MKRLFLIIVLLSASACAHPRHTAFVADSALYQVLADVHAGEQTALCGRPSCAGLSDAPIAGWSHEKSVRFNRALLPAVDAGQQFNRVLGTWQPGQPAPPQLHALIGSIDQALAAVTTDFPEGSTKTTLLANIGKAQAIVLQALDVILAVKGGR